MKGALLAIVVALPAIAGGIVAGTVGAQEGAAHPGRLDAEYDTSGPWSRTLAAGPYAALPVEEIAMPSFDGTLIHMGVFRPDVPNGTRVPVIVDAGPYYGDGDEPATSAQTDRLGGFLIENYVPHGYAVAQVSVRGTGLSGGCTDYMGEKEQRDLDALVTFLGERPWSSGAVAMIGRSYDGSTPWQAAASGNPYLKTIVPISGISDLQQLHYRNGTAEMRSVALGTLYYSFGATDGGLGPEEDPTRVARIACAEGPQHAPMGAYGALTGGGHALPGPADAYWSERSFAPRVLDRYQGSIFYVHGLQDWNVRPAQGIDVYNAFPGEKKALLGQWGHHYPDRPAEHPTPRWDWAETLLRWFDRELKAQAVDTGPAVEVQDHRGSWRTEPANAWPPQDAAWLALHPSADGRLVAEGSAGSASVIAPTMPANVATPISRVLSFETAPFESETRISGQPRLHVTVRSPAPGGNLWAELWEQPATGRAVQVGRAQMDLRYADGGRTPDAYVPNTDVLARMEFYPLDARLPAGSKLVLLLTGESRHNLANPATTQMTFTFGDDATSLQLPLVERAPPAR